MSAERWRTWEAPIAIDPVDQGLWLPGGRVLGEFQITWSPEMIERFRSGYKCVKCLEPQEVAWPEHCSLCGYRMRVEQAAYFASEFGGLVEVRGGTDWDEQFDGLEERRRKEEERARRDGQLRR